MEVDNLQVGQEARDVPLEAGRNLHDVEDPEDAGAFLVTENST